MNDLGTLFGFVAFIMAPCAMALFSRNRREHEEPALEAMSAAAAKALPNGSSYPGSKAAPSTSVFIPPMRPDTRVPIGHVE